jgi:hypothetical protein
MPEQNRSIEQVYRDWDAALHAKDVEAAIALYADDVRLESPLVRHLTNSARGIVEGRDRLREFLRLVFADPGEPWPLSFRLLHRWPEADLGVSAPDARWRSDGLRGSDGDRGRVDQATLRLLGLVRREGDRGGPLSPLSRVAVSTPQGMPIAATMVRRRASSAAVDAGSPNIGGTANAASVASEPAVRQGTPARSGRSGVVCSTRALATST